MIDLKPRMSISLFAPRRRSYFDQWSVVDPAFDSLLFPNIASEVSANRDFNKLAPLMTVDLIEAENSFQVHADLPGVNATDLEVSVDGKYLILQAERKHVHKTGTDKVHSMERTYGKVQRSIRLPNHVEVDKIKSQFKDGVLTIDIPKGSPPVASVKKLTIDTA